MKLPDLYGKTQKELEELAETFVPSESHGKPLFKIQISRKLEAMQRLIDAFENPETAQPEPKTWSQLSSLPKATRSRLLDEAVKKGYVSMSVTLKGRRPKVLYELRSVAPCLHVMVFRARLPTPNGFKDLGIFYPTRQRIFNEFHYRLPPSEINRLKKAVYRDFAACPDSEKSDQ